MSILRKDRVGLNNETQYLYLEFLLIISKIKGLFVKFYNKGRSAYSAFMFLCFIADRLAFIRIKDHYVSIRSNRDRDFVWKHSKHFCNGGRGYFHKTVERYAIFMNSAIVDQWHARQSSCQLLHQLFYRPNLEKNHKKDSLHFALNQRYAEGEELFNNGDEIAIFTAD